jgi:hypothetical protein
MLGVDGDWRAKAAFWRPLTEPARPVMANFHPRREKLFIGSLLSMVALILVALLIAALCIFALAGWLRSTRDS